MGDRCEPVSAIGIVNERWTIKFAISLPAANTLLLFVSLAALIVFTLARTGFGHLRRRRQ